MSYQAKLRKQVESGKIKVYFPDQIPKSGIFTKRLNVTGRGFCQYINDERIGYGINHAYEVLHTCYVSGGLPIESKFARAIEKAVGEDVLREYYISSNLSALVSNLGRYVSYEDTLIFIKNMDFLHSMLMKNSIFRKQALIDESREVCQDYLIRLASNKIAEGRSTGKICQGEALAISMEYADLITPTSLCAVSGEIDQRVKCILEGKSYCKVVNGMLRKVSN